MFFPTTKAPAGVLMREGKMKATPSVVGKRKKAFSCPKKSKERPLEQYKGTTGKGSLASTLSPDGKGSQSQRGGNNYAVTKVFEPRLKGTLTKEKDFSRRGSHPRCWGEYARKKQRGENNHFQRFHMWPWSLICMGERGSWPPRVTST